MVKSEYQLLYDAWKQAHPGISGSTLQKNVNRFWNEHKQTNAQLVKEKIHELREKVQNRNKQMTVSSWIKDRAGQRRESQQPPAASRSEEPADPRETESVCIEEVEAVRPAQARKSLAQEKLKDDLNVVIAEIARIEFLKNTRFITDQDKVKLKVLKKNEAKLHAQLKRLQTVARNSRTYRMTWKLKLKELSIKYPELASEINANIGNRPGSGRPRLEESQHLLLKTIVDIVAPEASTDQRRRSELLNSCKTLDDLQKELARQGFHISKSALYLRLLPRNSSTTEGKRHVKTVPVRLLRADKTKMKSHSDAHFAATTILHLRELAQTMGQECCFILSQDDKARILLGLPAANIQSPILMHMSYRVTLPDHDWVVAPGHKLIPSVYAGLDFDKRKLSYSGPTYIGIRSGKHDSSTAFSHACDFRRLIDLNEFKCLAKIPGSGEVKPIIIVFTDGGPDENPRFPKTLLEYAKHFKDFDLDAIFVACHAPGQSAYNQVERRMAPLSRDLSGIILPHQHYGSHLDDSGKTTDKDLELKNFEKAGETLADIWNSTVINGFPTVCEYITPNLYDNNDQSENSWLTQKWLRNHVRQSQYVLQIIRCHDSSCCRPWRSNLDKVLISKFLPAPVLFKQDVSGVRICNPDDSTAYFGGLSHRVMLSSVDRKLETIPYDYYCPSIQDQLESQTCHICNHYYVSKIAYESHKRAVHRSSLESILKSIESVVKSYQMQFSTTSVADDSSDSPMEVIENISDWIQSEFTDITDV